MRESSLNNTSNLKLHPISPAVFKELCIQYLMLTFEIDTNNTNVNDLPLSAFASDDSSLFKISNAVSIASFVTEIQNDLKFLSKIKSYSDIIYFNPTDDFIPHLVKRKIRNSVKSSKSSFEIISYSEIIDNLRSNNVLSDYHLLVPADLEHIYRSSINDSEKIFPIIDDIFNFVYNVEHTPTTAKSKKPSVDRLNQKIAVNFGLPERDKIRDYYLTAWGHKEIFEQYVLQNFDSKNEQLYAILSKIQTEFINRNYFKEIKTPVNYLGTLMDIAESLIPTGKEHHLKYLSISEAIVMYFFEYCDFGERFVNEQLSLFQKKIYGSK